MISIELIFGTRRFVVDLPETWQDIPPAKRLPLLRQKLTQAEPVFLFNALCELVDIPNSILRALPAAELNILSNVIFQATDIAPDPIPLAAEFDHAGETYYMPAADFRNGTAYEFALADTYAEKYIETGDIKNLIQIVATLARERNPNEADTRTRGDVRLPLMSEFDAEARAESLADLPPEKTMLVWKYFMGVKIKVAQAGEAFGMFDRHTDPDNPPPQNPANFGWWTILRQIAETGTFGTFDTVCHSNFWTIFAYMIEQKAAADRVKQEHKRGMEAGI
jgi:hypothetical protein